MDTSRISVGQMVGAVSGLSLLIALFLNWFAGQSAWELYNLDDIWLALIAIAAIVIALAPATQADLGVPTGASALLGAMALVIILSYLFEFSDRGFGLFLALLAALGIALGGAAAMSERRGAPPARRPRSSAPPSGGTSPGPGSR